MENELRFPSKIDNLVIVEKLIDDLSESYKFSSEVYGNILVALVEAVNNAIFHGNKNNSDKLVNVRYIISENNLTFIVKDEGNGFNINEVPDPTLPENIEKPNGRGLFLMRNLVDSINFNCNGSEVELKFKI